MRPESIILYTIQNLANKRIIVTKNNVNKISSAEKRKSQA